MKERGKKKKRRRDEQEGEYSEDDLIVGEGDLFAVLEGEFS